MAYESYKGLDYETASHVGDLEYGDVCSIVSVGHHSLKHTPRKAASRYEPKIIEGFTCLWNKPHIYRVTWKYTNAVVSM